MQKVLSTPYCYISIVTYTGIMHHYYNKRGCIVNEACRRVARYCFECAEFGVLISWKRMKERRGRRDKNGFANDPESKKSYNGPVPSIFRKLLSRSLW